MPDPPPSRPGLIHRPSAVGLNLNLNLANSPSESPTPRPDSGYFGLLSSALRSDPQMIPRRRRGSDSVSTTSSSSPPRRGGHSGPAFRVTLQTLQAKTHYIISVPRLLWPPDAPHPTPFPR
ncbi:unnamed protein product [Cutaneotrichosporon oleaginosum]